MSLNLVCKNEPAVTGLMWAVGVNGVVGLTAVLLSGASLVLSPSVTQETLHRLGWFVFDYSLPWYGLSMKRPESSVVLVGIAWLVLTYAFSAAIGKHFSSPKTRWIATATFFVAFPLANCVMSFLAGAMVALIGITQHGI